MTETMVDVTVTYSLTFQGKVYIVEHIQALIKSNKSPDKIIETPVYEYASGSGNSSEPGGRLHERSSLKWERCYDRRTAVERVNSRLDVSFGFDKHTIRGLTKMSTRCCLALAAMLAMAVGRMKANQAEAMRSLLKAA